MDPATSDDRRRRRLLIAATAGGLALRLMQKQVFSYCDLQHLFSVTLGVIHLPFLLERQIFPRGPYLLVEAEPKSCVRPVRARRRTRALPQK